MGHSYRLSSVRAATLMAVIAMQCFVKPTLASSIPSVELRHDSPRLDLSKPDSIASQSQLNNQWHSKPPPVLQHPCLAVDRHNDRTFIIGYDSQNALVFHYMNSTEACDSNKREKHKGEKADGEE
ncbi:hypothetical protein EDD21DRAFT_360245, partial [Dissophora ornata]